jgi:hypothetical protein
MHLEIDRNAFKRIKIRYTQEGIQMRRNTYYYELLQGRKVVYRGISKDPKTRSYQHRSEGKRFSSVRISSQPFKRRNAREYERNSIQKYRETHGRKPRYNRNA